MAEAQPLVASPNQAQMDAAQNSTSDCYNLLSDNVGNIYSCLSIPLGVCGGGPMVTIQQGFVGLITKFGKYDRLLPPGRYAYNIMSEAIIPVSLKTICLDVPPQNIMTSDNLSVMVNAVCYYRVVDACKAMFEVDNYSMAISQLAQVTLRTVLGEHDLNSVLTARSKINERITQLIDVETDKWGMKVLSVEMKDVQIPEGMRRAMAAVAESSREAEAKVITAKAQRDSAAILAEAAEKMKGDPTALQLQWFETLQKIAQEKNSTVIVPDSLLGMFSRLAK